MPKAMRSYLLPSLCTLLTAVCAGATDAGAQCAALHTFTGEAEEDNFGGSVSGAGDVDDDGYADLIVGAWGSDAGGVRAGRAYVYSGQTGALLYTFTGEAADDAFGHSVSDAGDVNNDGHADVIVGAFGNSAGGPYAGRAYVYSGQTGELLMVFTGESSYDQFGSSVSGAGDVDDDGYDDLIVGAQLNGAGGYVAGRAYVYSGRTGLLLWTFTGEEAGDQLGTSVSGVGDVDDDGHADLIVGAPHNDLVANEAGQVYVFSGKTGLLLHSITGERQADLFGSSVSNAGDVDNDGYEDIILVAGYDDQEGRVLRRAYVYSGDRGELLWTFTGEAVGDVLGASVSGAGDLDRDGFADLLVGARGNSAAGYAAEHAYVYSGRTGRRLLTYTGEAPEDWFGASVSGCGDVNGDGVDEVIVGAWGNDAGGTEAGRAYVLSLYSFGGAGDMPNCPCECHTDPQCDGVCNVLDVVISVGVAFRGLEAPNDQECSVVRTDADCDGDTDVFDVVRFVNVAFRNQPMESNFCDPWAP